MLTIPTILSYLCNRNSKTNEMIWTTNYEKFEKEKKKRFSLRRVELFLNEFLYRTDESSLSKSRSKLNRNDRLTRHLYSVRSAKWCQCVRSCVRHKQQQVSHFSRCLCLSACVPKQYVLKTQDLLNTNTTLRWRRLRLLYIFMRTMSMILHEHFFFFYNHTISRQNSRRELINWQS